MKPAFRHSDFDLGEFKATQHKIDTGDNAPVRQRMRRTLEHEEEEHLKKMLQFGVIQPSQSNWASAPVLVRKKDKSVRYCVDYRALNDRMVKDAFPLPRIEECLDALNGTQYFSTLDLASGYWQIKIDPEDSHKTAFITRHGLFEHVKMGFGLCNAPAIFQQAMNLVLNGLTWKTVLSYLDDLVVLGRSFADSLANLEEVFLRLRKYNLKLKPHEMHIVTDRCGIFGKTSQPRRDTNHRIQDEVNNGVASTKNRKEMEAFLGFMNYHRDYIGQFADLAEPLYQMVRKKAVFKWDTEQQAAFEALKIGAAQENLLAFPNEQDPFILDMDASDYAVAGVLIQVHLVRSGPLLLPVNR